MKVESESGWVDAEDEIHWIVERSKRLGEPLSTEVVRRVLQLQTAFALLTGDAVIVTRPCGDPAIICVEDEGDAVWEHPICRLCLLALGKTPPQGNGPEGTAE